MTHLDTLQLQRQDVRLFVWGGEGGKCWVFVVILMFVCLFVFFGEGGRRAEGGYIRDREVSGIGVHDVKLTKDQ